LLDLNVTMIVLIAVACVALPTVLARRLRRPAGPLAVAAILLLLFAAVGVRVPGAETGVSAILLDVSWSMGGGGPSPSDVAAGRRLRPERTHVIAFARTAPVLESRDGRWPIVGDAVRSAAGESASNLAAALTIASSLVGPNGVVTVVTDGRVGDDGLTGAATRVRSAGAGIEVVRAGTRVTPDAKVASLRMPGRVRANARVAVAVGVVGPPGTVLPVHLTVDGERVETRKIALGVSGASGFRFTIEGLSTGRHVISVAVTPPAGDTTSVNDRRGAGVVVEGAPRALLLNADALTPGLRRAGYDVATELPAGEPAGGELGGFDLVVIRDLPITKFPDRGESVRRYVEGGGGLVVVGGPRAFGPGGWGGTPLSECLPVRSHPEDEGLFVAVLLDRSGTMAETFDLAPTVKFDAARRATEDLLDFIPPGSEVLIIPFTKTVLGDPRPVRLTGPEARASLREALRVLGEPKGGTSLAAPLDRVAGALADVRAEKRLVLLFTDGRLEGEDEADVFRAAAAVRKAGGRIAGLAVGDDADRKLLDRLGGPGRTSVLVTAAGQVRQGFLDALFALQGERRLLEGPHSVHATGAPGLPELDLPTLPRLVRTWPRAGTTVWHETADGDPVTAGRRYGLGRSVAVTADLLDGPMMGALARVATRPAALSNARLLVEGDRLTAWLAVESTSVSGWLTAADGRRREVTLDAAGPDTFECMLPPLPAGAAFLDLAAPGVSIRAGLSVPWPAEYLDSGPDKNALRRLAARLGEDPATRESGSRDVSLHLAGLALLLFLADQLLFRAQAAGRLRSIGT